MIAGTIGGDYAHLFSTRDSRLMGRAFASFLRTLSDQLDPTHVSNGAKLDTIKDNHLAHIYDEVLGLSARIGSVEGQMKLIIGLLSLIFMVICGPIILEHFHQG